MAPKNKTLNTKRSKISEKETVDLQSCRSWSDLPIDILCLFAERLHFSDQICFRGVCKNWNFVKGIPSIDKFPWLMSYGKNITQNYICNFFDPCMKKTYTFRMNESFGGEEMEDFIGAEVVASKSGWLLLVNFFLDRRPPSIFFYNPFYSTAPKIIKLPPLQLFEDCPKHILFSYATKFTFSAIPSSEKCEVFVVFRCPTLNREISISKYRLGSGNEGWNTHVFHIHLLDYVKDLVYSKEKRMLYCVFTRGLLGAFCCASHEWSILSSLPLTYEIKIHLVESDGELLLIPASFRPARIFSFDWLGKVWVEKSSLGNRAIFANYALMNHVVSSCIVVSAAGETRKLAGRIYYKHSPVEFYSSETHTNQQCSEFYPEIVEQGFTKVWIEPPQ